MHDPTEGGVAGGIHEMTDAAHLGLRVFREKIAVASETAKICSHFDLDPLQLIGSGALLVAAEQEKAPEIIESLQRRGIQAAVMGEFTSDPSQRVLVTEEGQVQSLPRPSSDHLWRALRQSKKKP
jgi:hydrogenase maturation factor